MFRNRLWLYTTAFAVILVGVVWATLGMTVGSQPEVRPAAATLIVNSTGDAHDANAGDGACDDGTGKCTLRAAIEQAASGDSIDIPTGTYTLTLGTELVIDKSLTLTGAGSGDTIIQAATGERIAGFRVLRILFGNTVAISGVTIRHGDSAHTQCCSGHGGGIRIGGGTNSLTLTDSTVSRNWADGSGGGIWNSSKTLTSSTISGNTAVGGGGIYSSGGTVNLTNSTVSGNTAPGSDGGGISNRGSRGTVILTDSTVWQLGDPRRRHLQRRHIDPDQQHRQWKHCCWL